MTMAWEVTTEDVQQVCKKHGVKFRQDIFDQIDPDEVEHAVLSYTDFNNQVDAALCEIEDQLITLGIIPKSKKFRPPDYEDEYEDEYEEDE